MKLVADTNIFLAVTLGEPERAAILQMTAHCELVAPDVLPFEIGNALTAMLKRHVLRHDEVMTAWDTVIQMPVELRRVDIRRALQIACERNIYAYDGYVLECALATQCPLLTLDQRLRDAAAASGIDLLEMNEP